MLSYSRREWNFGLLQSLSRAIFSFLSQEGNIPSFARDHQTQGCVQSPWQNIFFASTFGPGRESRLQAHFRFPYCGCINPSFTKGLTERKQVIPHGSYLLRKVKIQAGLKEWNYITLIPPLIISWPGSISGLLRPTLLPPVYFPCNIPSSQC